MCVFFPFILDIKFVGRTSRGHTGRSHRISHPPSFCGACLNFSREKDSAVIHAVYIDDRKGETSWVDEKKAKKKMLMAKTAAFI